MYKLFKCSHPFKYLVVEKEHTEKAIDCDFKDISYHLFCKKCSENITLTHAKLIDGVDGFISRKGTL